MWLLYSPIHNVYIYIYILRKSHRRKLEFFEKEDESPRGMCVCVCKISYSKINQAVKTEEGGRKVEHKICLKRKSSAEATLEVDKFCM